jgi:hypothetical protein
MTTQHQLRRDTTANIAAITPAQGEPVFDVTRNALTIGDGAQAGGHYATPFTGSWTPTISGSTTPGSQSYAVQEGWYCKLGKLVIAQCRITLTGNSGGSGAARVAGLPFTSENVANSHGSGAIAAIGGVTHAASYTQFHASVNPNATTADLSESGSNQLIANVPITNVGAAADLIITFTYLAAADND